MKRPPITEQHFYKYLKCPAWVFEDFSRGEARESLLAKLQNEGLIRENEIRLLGGREFVEVDTEDMDDGARRTLELMKKGVQTIYKGVLMFEQYVGRPDILERVEGKSVFGDWYYVACDIKRSSHLKEEYKYQGSFYAMILERIQNVKPINGYVIHGGGEKSSYVIDEFEPDFRDVLDRIERIHGGERESHFLTSGYKQSPYFETFLKEVEACDHLSLLNRVWKSEISAIEGAGIKTVSQLADAKLAELKKIPDLSLDRLYFLQQQAISIKEKRVIFIGTIDLPRDPEGALVLDIESDPLRDLDYLFGVLEVVPGSEPVFHSFFADSEKDEGKAWEKFMEFMESRAHLNVYHYGWYEIDVMRRMKSLYGMPESVEKQLEARFIDLLTKMRDTIIFPMPFYSLKDIAKFLGFAWRTKDASGLDSVLWYEDFLVDGDPKAKQKIIDYNEDDVRATWFLKKWIEKEMSSRL